ncbi:MAG: SpaH/EbpB family LPXTG-anchored major pilin [Eubacteriales bacterium]|nr:SpaH/EbpB family LPXTG-anchored major pilin [Eubacteriales bacterium]
MKKKSRFLTGLLSAVMALSLFALPAAADQTRVPTLPAIDTHATGTLTIHKYEYNGTASPNGTGEATDSSKVPTAEPNVATPLDGVTFTLYKVMNADQLKKYYENAQGSSVNSVTITDYVQDNVIKDKDNYSADKGNLFTAVTGATGSAGVAKIELPVGMYAVVETKVPAGVTEKTPAFLVSVPMTDNAGKNWLYDIEVFPKNKTSYTGVTLHKQGKTGGKDASATALADFTFELEKWSDTENKWIKITSEAEGGKDNAGKKDVITTTDDDGAITIGSLTQGIYRFTETGGPAKSEYIIDAKTHYVFEVKQDETTGQLAVAPVTKDATKGWDDANNNYDCVKSFESETVLSIVVDNYKPDLTKSVQNREKNNEGNFDYSQDADYSANDNVNYKLDVVVPQNIADLKTFYVEDNPADKNALQYIEGSVKVFAGDTELTADTDFKVEKTNDGGFKVDFKAVTTATINNWKGQTITIKYQYKLTNKANSTVSGNVNKAELNYSHNAKTGVGENDNPRKIHNEGVVYTFATNILKKGDDDALLGGVEFELYKEVSKEDTTGKTVLNDTDAKAKGLDVTEGKKWVFVEKKSTSSDEGTKGQLTFDGLSNGTYYLVETKTNAGYNLLSKPVKVELTISHVTSWTKDTWDEEGKVFNKHSENTTTFTGTGWNGNKFDTTTVINRKGFTLPTTGGFGTLLFSGIGALLVVGGVGVLMSTKKKKGNT